MYLHLEGQSEIQGIHSSALDWFLAEPKDAELDAIAAVETTTVGAKGC